MSDKLVPLSNSINSFGISLYDKNEVDLSEAAKQVKRDGFTVVDSGYSTSELVKLSKVFNQLSTSYIQKFDETFLKSINEFNIVRAPLSFGNSLFISLANNQQVLNVVSELIAGKFILNQQNCVNSFPNENGTGDIWHRDLPYQNYISNQPLAVSAIFCVDDFTPENGATMFLPETHKRTSLPSEAYIKKKTIQVEAKAGNYILFDSMIIHKGGVNRSKSTRRLVNHVYTIPYFKQQIQLSEIMSNISLTLDQKDLFGFNDNVVPSISSYLSKRE